MNNKFIDEILECRLSWPDCKVKWFGISLVFIKKDNNRTLHGCFETWNFSPCIQIYFTHFSHSKRNFISQSSHVINLLSLQTCYMYSSTLANAHAPRPHFDMSFKHSWACPNIKSRGGFLGSWWESKRTKKKNTLEENVQEKKHRKMQMK